MTLQNITDPPEVMARQLSLKSVLVEGNWLPPVAMVRPEGYDLGASPEAVDWKDGCAGLTPDTADAVLDGTAPPRAKALLGLDALHMALYESECGEVLGEFPQPQEYVPAISSANPFSVLHDEFDGCARLQSLCGKAKTLVKYYTSFGLVKIRDPPSIIECGGLRSAVRNCFSEVDPLWELSFKTVAKVEKNCCSYCLPRFEESLDRWVEDRFIPQDVDYGHVALFKECVRRNVEKGWDRFRRPFIPNGHATLANGRRVGGNWNTEPFSEEASACLVFSSGKPRVVTKYSSFNTSVLGELHYSLHHCLQRSGWLLVGDPTDKHVQSLTGADFLSFDYKSATDNIKAPYVRAAVDVLKEQAENLTDDEIRCLDVLSNLKLEGDNRVATRGQPMGSVMSFPLLCVINKSVVDLALNRMLVGGEISFPEWSSHRCFVNGDDLLTREVRTGTNFRGILPEEGNKVGLIVNEEKTMSSRSLAEINSTLFLDGQKQRKFNASSVWMDSDVSDVLGFASQACPDSQSFRRVVRSNAHILAKQEDKFLDMVPVRFRRICRVDRKIRSAIVSAPVIVRPKEEGPIRMARRPEGYDLSPSEEHEAMRAEIIRVREKAIRFFSRPAMEFRTPVRSNAFSYTHILKLRRKAGQEVIPSCYLRWFRKKTWESVLEADLAVRPTLVSPVLDESRVSYIVGLIRSRKRETAVRNPGTFEQGVDLSFTDGFKTNCNYVKLDCSASPVVFGS